MKVDKSNYYPYKLYKIGTDLVPEGERKWPIKSAYQDTHT